MKINPRKITIFSTGILLLFIFFVLYDYFKFNELNWIENFLKSLFILAFVRILSWLFDSKKQQM
ncbi:hypothetical protein CJ483_21970 [Bacillus sp. PK3_68]|nr:hypothetical protein CJ483_21970 [Bacillus sp. PK3_68]